VEILLAEFSESLDGDAESTIFRRPGSLRLTYTGHRHLSKLAKCWVFEHTDQFLTKHIIGLSALTGPWYLSHKYFAVYSDEDALLLKLHGSVQQFLEKAQIFNS
jgi:hypothetical protein